MQADVRRCPRSILFAAVSDPLTQSKEAERENTTITDTDKKYSNGGRAQLSMTRMYLC